jgi:hypothetical protein
MHWSKNWSAAGLVLAFALHSDTIAFAQDAEVTEVVVVEEEVPAEPSTLDEMVDVRSDGNEAAEGVQEAIDTISDETQDLMARYRTALKQVDSLNIYTDQMRSLIAAQEVELASLVEQRTRVQAVGRSVTPLMTRMIDGLEKFVELDIPFLKTERDERVDGLRLMMVRSDVTTPEKYRQIMEAYQIENEYGRTIEAYRASIMLGNREVTVDFLRFGRIALVYQSPDEAETGAWSQAERKWVELDPGEYRSAIRAGLRIARKQVAPDLIRLPLPAPVDERGV